ncbi:MAG: FAD-dependent oxidoreductase [Gemmatimonadetes bacterium]|nr:FAD-dependent oxidoreductase [Gemmatimonadota bacterium]
MPQPRSVTRATVIGAGAFGGWTALHLLRRGVHVTLWDAWGPANPRASSGDDTRIIRATYGPDRIYVDLTLASFPQWRALQKATGQLVLRETGALWLAARDDRWERDAMGHLRDAGVPHQQLSPTQAKKRYPLFNFSGVNFVIEEPGAAYLRARAACALVLGQFLAEGGTYREGRVEAFDGRTPPDTDIVVYACGPWMGKLFPDVIGDLIRPTRQELFYFGLPSMDGYRDGQIPVWLDRGPGIWYSIPSGGQGIKLASDDRGPVFDPDNGDRGVTPAVLAEARAKLAERLPSLAKAPFLDGKACQYEQTPDSHFIIDRHPKASNVWLVGGGSGHGFKHGPAVGELVAECALERRKLEPTFLLKRFAKR